MNAAASIHRLFHGTVKIVTVYIMLYGSGGEPFFPFAIGEKKNDSTNVHYALLNAS